MSQKVMNKLMVMYENKFGKYDPLLVWYKLLEESGGDIVSYFSRINALAKKDKSRTPEEEIEMVQIVVRIGEIGKQIFGQNKQSENVSTDSAVSDNSTDHNAVEQNNINDVTIFEYYQAVLDFVNWFSKKN